MDFKGHTEAKQLETYAFWWSEARLIVAALALAIGGMPPILAFNPVPALFGMLSSFLTLAWIISGVAAVYLAYRWHKAGQRVFGEKKREDLAAFGIMVITGFNLGFAGIFGTNIGMSISSNKIIFLVVAMLYVAAAGYLYKRWHASGNRLF